MLSDGKHATPLVPAQDHKRIGEGDTGPNTGGMGAYSTDEMLDAQMSEWILHHIAQKTTADGMAAEETPFVGVLYCGLMMTAKGPMVLEFNARFGDPETQAILPRMESDLVEALEACIEGRLSETEFRWKPGASACVSAASAGYPGIYDVGLPIAGLEEAARLPGVEVFHAGTTLDGGVYHTSGGRVLGVTATGDTLEEALGWAYEAMGRISFEGMVYRRDIGRRALGEEVGPPRDGTMASCCNGWTSKEAVWDCGDLIRMKGAWKQDSGEIPNRCPFPLAPRRVIHPVLESYSAFL